MLQTTPVHVRNLKRAVDTAWANYDIAVNSMAYDEVNERGKCAELLGRMYWRALDEWQENYYNHEYYMTSGEMAAMAYGQANLNEMTPDEQADWFKGVTPIEF